MMVNASMARQCLPHPLAVLHDPLAVPSADDRLPALLAFAEGAAHFLAWILVADAAASGAPASALRPMMQARSFGQYLHAIAECLKARATRTRRMLPELDALAQGAVQSLLDRACRLRNDRAHHRLPRDPASERRIAAELEPGLAAVRDALALFLSHPLGMMRRITPRHDGVLVGEWVTLRGLSLYSGHATLERADGLPERIVVLLDTNQRRALSLHPFFLCDGRSFSWLELPIHDGESRPYRMPSPEQPGPEFPRRGLADPSGLSPDGIGLDAWLADPTLRPRIIDLAFGPEAMAEIRRRANPTHFGGALQGIAPTAPFAPPSPALLKTVFSPPPDPPVGTAPPSPAQLSERAPATRPESWQPSTLAVIVGLLALVTILGLALLRA